MDFSVPIRTTQPISELSVVVTGCTLLSVDVRSLLMTSSDSEGTGRRIGDAVRR